MPKSGVTDAQHVVYTDHSIPRRPRTNTSAPARAALTPFGGGQAVPRDTALALGILGWHRASRSAITIHALRLTMVLAIVSAGIGFALHYRANAEFQLDIDPSMGGPALWMKVLRAKAPPALAPGVMAHLGLLGLAYTYRHPALQEPVNSSRSSS